MAVYSKVVVFEDEADDEADDDDDKADDEEEGLVPLRGWQEGGRR